MEPPRAQSPLVPGLPAKPPIPALSHDQLARHNTPVALRVSENSPAKSGVVAADYGSRYRWLGAEIERHCLGPMPPRTFLDTFLPALPQETVDEMPPVEGAFDSVPFTATEHSTFKKLAEAINDHGRCPGYLFFDTSAKSMDGSSKGAAKPGGSAYSKENSHLGNVADLGYTELTLELKSRDSFTDPAPGSSGHPSFFPNLDSLGSLQEIGQSVYYATEVLARQHRTFCFSLFVFHRKLRFARWDRAGVIVSAAYDYYEDPEPLCQFLWRFSHASDEARGYDTTVSLATPAEENLFKEVITRHIRHQLGLVDNQDIALEEKELARHYLRHRVTALVVRDEPAKGDDEPAKGDGEAAKCDDEAAKAGRKFLVCCPIVSPSSVASPATRGYWAVDAELHTIAFLKDTWRISVNNVEKEGIIVQRLTRAKVRNLPVVARHGDVFSTPGNEPAQLQCTATDLFRNKEWVCVRKGNLRVARHVHYRMVSNTVGSPLTSVTGSEEMLLATRHAYEAMLDANSLADTLHRDISIGNIILIRPPNAPLESARRGVLIDWELSWCARNQAQARQYDRTGTWPFLSARLASNDELDAAPHRLDDDVESIIYVVLFCALLYITHGMDDRTLSNFVQGFFHQVQINRDGVAEGGAMKIANRRGEIYTRRHKFECPALKGFIHPALQCLARQGEPEWDMSVHVKNLWDDAIKAGPQLKDRQVHRIEHATTDVTFRATTMRSSRFTANDTDDLKRPLDESPGQDYRSRKIQRV